MQTIKKKKIMQTIMILLVILTLFNFIMPNFVYAVEDLKNKTVQECITLNNKLENKILQKVKGQLGDRYSDEMTKNLIEQYKNDSNVISVNLKQYSITEMNDLGIDNPYDIDSIIVNTTNIAESNNNDDDEASADGIDRFFGVLLSPINGLIAALGDTINTFFRKSIVGNRASYDNNRIYKSTISGDSAEDYIAKNAPSTEEDENLPSVYIKRKNGGIDKSTVSVSGGLTYTVAAIDFTPAEIFAGRISALNANFFKTSDDYSDLMGGTNKSIVNKLKDVVSQWYVAIRNIAIVGLMSVLIYMGIRIVISSNSNDKAKYKQMLVDWLVALCLIFFMHYIMAFAMTMSEQVTSMIAGESTNGPFSQCIIKLYDEKDANGDYQVIANRQWKSNFINVARMKMQYDNATTKLGYTSIYICLSVYTAYFTIVYLKRLLMLAFYTMIAPMVALTYPIDKVKDGKAQAFNFWFKDYTFYAFLPVLHMLLYRVLVQSALDLAAQNMIYAIVAMAFIVPAEKIFKKMFNISGNTEERMGSFAGGAIASSLFHALAKPPKPPKGEKGVEGGEGGKPPRVVSADDNAEYNDLFEGSTNTPVSSAAQSQGAQNNEERAGGNSQQNDSVPAEQYLDDIDALDDPNSHLYQNNDERQGTPSNDEQDNNFEIPISAPEENNDAGSQARTPDATIPTRRSLWNRLGNTNLGKAVGRRYKRAGGQEGIQERIAKGIVKGTAKGAGMALGAAAFGAVGLGIGMVGGDLSDAYKGLLAGATAGAYTANRLGAAGGRVIPKVGAFASEVRYGSAEEASNVKARKAYMSDAENLDRIARKHPQFDAQQVQEFAGREYDMMRDADVTDVKLAEKALKVEDVYREVGLSAEDAHIRAAQVLNGAKEFDKSTFKDAEKRRSAEEANIQSLMKNKGYSREEAARRTQAGFDEIEMIYSSQARERYKRNAVRRPTRINRSNNGQNNSQN